MIEFRSLASGARLIVSARILLFATFFIACSLRAVGQQVAPLWQEFVQARTQGATPVLPDFSFAGYHFSEKPLPAVDAARRFDVTKYGAVPNDGAYDDEGIQAAIRAAEEGPDGGIVFFPPGRYLISPDEDPGKCIRITKSNIVLKGSGTGAGGTEIFQDKMRIGSRQILFRPAATGTEKLATITRDVPRETFAVEVDNTAGLHEGQTVVIRHRSEAFTRFYFSPLALHNDWERLFGEKGGMVISEIHTIEAIKGRQVVFKNPLHFELKVIPGKPFELHSFAGIRECGLEDIRFSSSWKNYPEEFEHHKNKIHDYAWEAVGMEYVEDSWIRNCEFSDLNEAVFMRAAYRVTVTNTVFSGKKGHASVHARSGYGVLIRNCRFNGSHHHGPGTGYSGVGTVITNCSLGVDQNIDSHSGQPYATLFDAIDGGVFSNLGGPMPGFPHHGKYLVMWNFQHTSSKDYHYNFWNLEKRKNYTIAQPVFVGFRANTHVTFEQEGVNQLPGLKAEPASLFDAQLNLRLQTTGVAR